MSLSFSLCVYVCVCLSLSLLLALSLFLHCSRNWSREHALHSLGSTSEGVRRSARRKRLDARSSYDMLPHLESLCIRDEAAKTAGQVATRGGQVATRGDQVATGATRGDWMPISLVYRHTFFHPFSHALSFLFLFFLISLSCPLSLCLSLSHTHTHTDILTQRKRERKRDLGRQCDFHPVYQVDTVYVELK